MSEFKQIVLTIDDVARSLGLSVSTIRRMWAAGDIPAPIRFGRRNIRWMKSDLESWAKKLEPATPATPVNRVAEQKPEESYP